MTVETVTYISDLDPVNPSGSDPKSEGDNHLRNIKTGLKNTFPDINGVVSVSQGEINQLNGLTENVQTKLSQYSASLSAVTSDLGRFSASISAINTFVGINSASIPALNTQVSGLSSSISQIWANMATISLSVSALNTQVGKLSSSISQIWVNVGALSASISQLDARTTILSASVSALNSLTSRLGSVGVYKKFSGQTFTSGSITNISWSVTGVETLGFWTSTDDTKIVIPAGSNIRVARFNAMLEIYPVGTATATFQVYLFKNNSFLDVGGFSAFYKMTGGDQATFTLTSNDVSVAAGDYFQVRVYPFLTDVKTTNGSGSNYFGISVIK